MAAVCSTVAVNVVQQQKHNMKDSDLLKLRHDTLLREVHNMDCIVEMHSSIVVVVSGTMWAFVHVASNLHNGALVKMISVFGIVVVVEWVFKLSRHKNISDTCMERLRDLEGVLEIDALRPKPCLSCLNGICLLFLLAIAILAMWLSLITLCLQGTVCT